MCFVTICSYEETIELANINEIYINDTNKFNICSFNVAHLETFLIRKVDRYYVDIHKALHVSVY